jgi:hypothetical protein
LFQEGVTTPVGVGDTFDVITAYLAVFLVSFASAAAVVAITAHYFRAEISQP